MCDSGHNAPANMIYSSTLLKKLFVWFLCQVEVFESGKVRIAHVFSQYTVATWSHLVTLQSLSVNFSKALSDLIQTRSCSVTETSDTHSLPD